MLTQRRSLTRTVGLGVINGLSFGILAEVVMSLLYEYEIGLGGRTDPATTIDMAPYPWAWWYLPLISTLLVTTATFVVHCFLGRRIKSPFWFWEAVGLFSVAGLYLLTLSVDWWNARSSSLKADYWQFAPSLKLAPWILLVPALLVFNLLFAWIANQIKTKN